jgi:hypothetical protein
MLVLIVLITAMKLLTGFIRIWNLSNFNRILFCGSTVREGQALLTFSPSPIPILCYFVPIHSSYLSCVILWIIFPSSLESPLRILSSTHTVNMKEKAIPQRSFKLCIKYISIFCSTINAMNGTANTLKCITLFLDMLGINKRLQV